MGGRKKDSVLTDTLEAIIGWMYCDLGLSMTQEFVLTHIYRDVGHGQINLKSYKSLIQEYFQQKHKTPPIYTDIPYTTDQYGNITVFQSTISCEDIV